MILFSGWISKGFSQNELTFGRHGLDCRGSGICSFTTASSRSLGNAKILYQDENVILRIYRDRITKEEEKKLLGSSRVLANGKMLSIFHLESELPLTENIQKSFSKTQTTITKISSGDYPMSIEEKYIDILILKTDQR